MRALLKKLLGVLCIIAGIAFGFLPLIPGVLLILVGLELLGVPIVPWEKVKGYWRTWKGKRREEEKEIEE